MTALWTAHDLAEATGGVLTAPFAATGVSIDTRTLAPGDLFVALLGEAGDGHRFVAGALARGAAGAMVHAGLSHLGPPDVGPPDVGPPDVGLPDLGPLLRVDDTLAALARLGGYARARFTGRLVAVTGSVGKTTTKEMLRTMLAALGPTHAAVASYNNHWGLPLTLARLPADAAYCVAEIGMNHAGEIAPLARLARPHVAVITAVEKAHIGYLGSLEAIADEKACIVAGLEPGGVAVLPLDTPMLPRLLAAAARVGARVVGFGSAEAAAPGIADTVRLCDARMDAEGSDVTADVLGTRVAFRLNAPGRHMVMNALAALAAASMLAGAGVAAGVGVAGVAAAPNVSRPGLARPPTAGVRAASEDLGGRPSPAMTRGNVGGADSPATAPVNAGDAAAPVRARAGTLAAALANFAPLSGRGIRRALHLPAGMAQLLDESYNGNGASMRAALAVLALQPAQRRVAVLGDMLELGDAGPAEHIALAAPAAAAADLVFTCGPLMRHLHDALPPAQRGAHAADSAALAPLVAHALRPGDAVLVKGSLGSRMRRVVDQLDSLAATHDTEAAA
jgi:UDP-N-acetylmuramoyl-tripeptide--D-alanyl-D-alanine ligase